MTETVVSYDTELIGKRFMVKVSSDIDKKIFLVATQDLLEEGFSLKYFKDYDDVATFLKLLQIAAK